MNTRVKLLSFSVMLGLAANGANAALDRTGDFALMDSDGKFHQLSRYQHRQAVVLMSYAATCQNMAPMVEEYKTLQSRYAEQGIEFLLIDSQDRGRSELAALDLGIPILQDSGQLISEVLGLTVAGEVRVLNPDRMSLFYSGAVGSELDQTLGALLAGPVRDTVKAGTGDGCALSFPVRDAQKEKVPDYATEVAPIIIENCVECHRQWGAGPFAMDRHVSLLGWSPMIKEVILSKRMPPAQIDPDIGHSTTARYLSTADNQTVVHWINAGGPRGDSPTDPLAELKFEERQPWLLGEPDLVISTPLQKVPVNGILEDIYLDLELPFTVDTWVRAVQYQPTGNGALHQMVAYVTAPGEDFWGAERTSTHTTRRFLESYSPGRPIVAEFAEGSGLFIPKGHKLSMQFQYVGMGAELNSITEIGLYLADNADGELQERVVQAVSAQFVLPADQNDIPMQAEHVFDENVIITGVRARMNERGKNVKFSVERPDGTTEDILSIPAYNYAWQPHYVLEHPVTVPAGSRVVVSGAFDNSVSNPFNPDPMEEIASGVTSEDEMFTGYLTYHKDTH